MYEKGMICKDTATMRFVKSFTISRYNWDVFACVIGLCGALEVLDRAVKFADFNEGVHNVIYIFHRVTG